MASCSPPSTAWTRSTSTALKIQIGPEWSPSNTAVIGWARPFSRSTRPSITVRSDFRAFQNFSASSASLDIVVSFAVETNGAEGGAFLR